MNVQGAGPIAALNLRCLAVLAVVNVTVVAVAPLLSRSPYVWGDQTPVVVYMLVVALVVACVPVWLVGYPVGILTAHLLRNEPRERVHVAVFALVGAVLSVACFGSLGSIGTFGWVLPAVAAEGAVGAGVARWWSGLVRARRARKVGTMAGPLPWGRMAP